jgi:REP element-mobilizing transposase RayT
MHAYLATTVRSLDAECYRVGGTADHVHLALRLPRTLTIAKLVEAVKANSSKWIKTHDASLQNFAWQRGYGAFSVSKTHLQPLIQYIENQEEHHRALSFQDEYRSLLEKLGIDFDERYVWD